MIGLTKDDVIKAVGIPPHLEGTEYIYDNFHDATNSSITIVFPDSKHVSVVSALIRLQKPMASWEVRSAINGSPKGPENVEFYDDVKSYWEKNDEPPSSGTPQFECRLTEKVSKFALMKVRGVAFIQPPVTAKRTVNTAKNSIDLTPFQANPLFDWRQGQVGPGVIRLFSQHFLDTPTEAPFTKWPLR